MHARMQASGSFEREGETTHSNNGNSPGPGLEGSLGSFCSGLQPWSYSAW